MNETITEKIFAELDEIHKMKDNIEPSVLAEKLVILSTYYAHLTAHLAELERQYYKTLDLAFESEEKMTAAKAKIKAQAGDEYRKYLQAKNLALALVEQIRSIKIFIRVKQGDYEVSKNL